MARLKTGPKVVIAALAVGVIFYGADKAGLFDNLSGPVQQSTVQTAPVQVQIEQQKPVEQVAVQKPAQVIQPVQPVQVQQEAPVAQPPARNDRGMDALMQNANKK